jgi:uncharacterized membrane protein YphA (DoxX/SURF4 family)
MNGQGARDRLLKVSPLVLRLGVAAVLAIYGIGEVGNAFGGQTEQHAVVDAAGVDVEAGWGTLLGFGACGLACMLVLGLLTRLASLGALGGIAWWAKGAFAEAPADTVVETAGTLTETANTMTATAGGLGAETLAMLLLAAIAASLLVSGCGCLGLDCRLFGRRKKEEPVPL